MLYGICPYQSSSIAMLISTINQTIQINLPGNVKVSEKTQGLLKKLLVKDYYRRVSWIELFGWFEDEEGLTGNQKQDQNINNIDYPPINKT